MIRLRQIQLNDSILKYQRTKDQWLNFLFDFMKKNLFGICLNRAIFLSMVCEVRLLKIGFEKCFLKQFLIVLVNFGRRQYFDESILSRLCSPSSVMNSTLTIINDQFIYQMMFFKRNSSLLRSQRLYFTAISISKPVMLRISLCGSSLSTILRVILSKRAH